MSAADPQRLPDDEVGATTEKFRAFTQQDEIQRPKAVGAPFRILTLLLGLAALAGAIWLLFRI